MAVDRIRSVGGSFICCVALILWLDFVFRLHLLLLWPLVFGLWLALAVGFVFCFSLLHSIMAGAMRSTRGVDDVMECFGIQKNSIELIYMHRK